MLLQYTRELGIEGSQALKQKTSEPTKLIYIDDQAVRHGDGYQKEPINALVPLDNLLERVVVSVVAGERIGVNERTEGITTLHASQRQTPPTYTEQNATCLISAVRVHLTTFILAPHVDVLLHSH
jgi:hypothetical protein